MSKSRLTGEVEVSFGGQRLGTAVAIETEPTLEDRRRAVEEVKGEVLALLGKIVEGTSRPPVVTYPTIEGAQQEAMEIIEALEGGASIALPSVQDATGQQWHVEWDNVDRDAFRRLLWLCGLSAEERAFVEDAAKSAGNTTAETLGTFAVFADWLEDQQRSEEAGRIRRLAPEAGEVLVLNVNPALYRNAPEHKAAVDLCARGVDTHMRNAGRECFVTVCAAGVPLVRLPAEQMEKLGWMRVDDHEGAFAHLRDSLDGEPEGAEIGTLASRQAVKMIERLKRENAELRRKCNYGAACACKFNRDRTLASYCALHAGEIGRAVVAEREACAAFVEDDPCLDDVESGRRIAAGIRDRIPIEQDAPPPFG